MTNRLAVSSLVLVAILGTGPLRPGRGAGGADAAVPLRAVTVPPTTTTTTTTVGTNVLATADDAAATSSYTPLTPARLLDTRPGTATVDGQGAGAGPLAAGATLEIVVGGRGGVPGNAGAAVLNVTSTGALGNGFLTVWPCGAARPLASSLNFSAGRDVANAVLTKLGTSAKVCVYAGAAVTHLVVDVNGWYAAGSGFTGSTPARLMDTRTGAGTVDGQGAGGGIVAAGATVELTVGGRGGVPAGVAAAVLNVTSTGALGNGFLTVWPCGAARPLASSLNFSAGRDVANAVLTKLGTAAKVCVYAGAAATHLVVDVTGWYPAGTDFTASNPARLMDSRSGASTVDGEYAGVGALPAGQTVQLLVTERGGVPIDAGAVVLNVTSTGASGSGFLTVWPCGEARPLASSLNFSAGRDAANAVLSKVGDGDQVCVYAGAAATELVVDVTGWFPGGTPGGGTITPNPPPPTTTPLPPITPGVWQRVTPPGIRIGAAGADDFGMQAMASSASDRRVVYVGSSYFGIWRTSDAGTNWAKVNTGSNGANLDTGRNWAMAVDPTNSNVLYTAAGYGNGQGVWKSIDGGRDWNQMLPASVLSQATADIYSIAIDPNNAAHLLVGSHGPWAGNSDAGVLESFNGGTSWTIHPAQGGWGWGHYVFFISSTTWLLATQGDGYWRTTNSGTSWAKVSDQNMTHGGGALYRAANGVLYAGAINTVLRSTDNGASWSEVGPRVQDGYYAIVSDGARMYVQSGNTGGNTLNPDPPFYTSPESDGVTWTPQNGGAAPFPENGPFYAVFDPTSGIIMSSNWLAGVWRYKAS